MPDAATAHTKAGAKAFVTHFWQVVNYAQATGDTVALKRLSAVGCVNCDAGIASVKRVYAAGGRILGGTSTLTRLRASTMKAGDTWFATVKYVNAIAAQTTDYPGDADDKRTAPRTFTDRVTLIAAGDSLWTVAAFEVVS
ncbi:DUF6318 family protein [Nocardioides panacihumi]